MRVHLAVVERTQRQVVAIMQSERGRGDLLVRPHTDGVARRKRRRMERTQDRLRIGYPKLARDTLQTVSGGTPRQEPALLGVADDLQRHGLRRAAASGDQRPEQVLG